MAIVRHGPTQCAHEPGCPHDIGPAAAGVTSAANALAAAPELRTGMHERQGSGPVERRMETEAERESRLAAYERQALATRIAEDRTKAARERAQQAQEGEAMTRPARQRKATDEEILAALRRHRGNRNAAAGELGMTVTPMTKHCERIAAAGAMPADVAELLASRSQYGRRAAGLPPVVAALPPRERLEHEAARDGIVLPDRLPVDSAAPAGPYPGVAFPVAAVETRPATGTEPRPVPLQRLLDAVPPRPEPIVEAYRIVRELAAGFALTSELVDELARRIADQAAGLA